MSSLTTNSNKQDEMKILRKFHNQIKHNLIQNHLKNLKIIDLGFGYAGDLHKYEKAQIKRIIAIEPDIEHIYAAQERIQMKLKETTWPRCIEIVHAGAQETAKIMYVFETLNECKMDAAAAFFSLTFAFESEAILDQWIETIRRTVHSRGRFVGTIMDGEATFSKLKSMQMNQTFKGKEFYQIQKLYNDEDIKKSRYGNKIQIHMNGTIVENQFEYLMWFDLLQKKLEAIDFQLVFSELFNPPQKLVCKELLEFSTLFRYFVFEKKSKSL